MYNFLNSGNSHGKKSTKKKSSKSVKPSPPTQEEPTFDLRPKENLSKVEFDEISQFRKNVAKKKQALADTVKLTKSKYPHLTEKQAKILGFIIHEKLRLKNPFSLHPWTIANWLSLPTKVVKKTMEEIVQDSSIKITVEKSPTYGISYLWEGFA